MVEIVAGLTKTVKESALEAVVSSIHFEQFDGTTSLPFRSNGKYHLGGRVVVTPPETFKRIVEGLVPIIREKGNRPCIIILPLPGYLFGHCCGDTSHCINTQDKDFPETLLAGFVQMRNYLIRQLVSHRLTNFKVIDLCCATNCSLTANVWEWIVELRKVTAKDGVHLIDDGYRNITKRSIACISQLLSGTNKTGCASKPTVHFWRGFRSVRGSMMPRVGSIPFQSVHGQAARGAYRGLSTAL